MKLYIASNSRHCDVIIRANTEKECRDLFAKVLGYKDYGEMEIKLGKRAAKLDSICMYEED